jgi:hypothetical protein
MQSRPGFRDGILFFPRSTPISPTHKCPWQYVEFTISDRQNRQYYRKISVFKTVLYLLYLSQKTLYDLNRWHGKI